MHPLLIFALGVVAGVAFVILLARWANHNVGPRW
jgi:hypothetical protein